MALSRHVVVLIKDLNGNHVIQKCLNKLTPEDNQVRQSSMINRFSCNLSSYTMRLLQIVSKLRLIGMAAVYCNDALIMHQMFNESNW